jgi:predicted PurR-regulated permease PerM
MPDVPHRPILTITPNNANPVPTERYVRLLVVLTTGLLILLAIYLAIRALSLIHHTVLLFSLGGLVAYALDPIVELVRGKPVPAPDGTLPAPPGTAPIRQTRQRPRWLGVVTVFVTVLAALGLVGFLVGRQSVRQAQSLVRERVQIASSFQEKLDAGDVWLASRGIDIHLSDMVKHPPPSVKKWGASLAQGSLLFASDFTRSVVEGAVVLLITVYFLLFSEELRGATADAFPPRVRPYVSQWQDDVNRILGGFVRGQAVLALVLGAAAAVVCGVLGLRFWLLVGAFVVIASLIPVLGAYIGAIPAIISALLTPAHGFLTSGVRVTAVVILFILINEYGSKVLYPRLVGKALGLHELLVLFVLLAGFEVGGIVGVLFAAPLTALATVTVLQTYRFWLGEPPDNVGAEATAGGEAAEAAGVP